MLRLLLLTVLCLNYCAPRSAEGRSQEIKRITLGELQEKVQENKGRVLVVDFWATYCAPCREEMPFLNDLYETYKEKGLEIIGINIEGAGEEVVRPFVEMLKVRYPIFLGGDDIIEAYDIQYIPLTYILGKDSRVKMKETGFKKDTSVEKFRRQIEELLK